LTAAVPASLRAPGDTRLNNQVVFSLCRLATDVPDPLPRLAATRVAAREGKDLFADMKDLVTTDVSVLGAPIILTLGYRLLQSTSLLWCNVVISNIPGPRQPMYCAGAVARHHFPLSIPFHGCALNITVVSYVGQLEFGLTACREAVPDVQLIADYLAEDFEAMRRAHEALQSPDGIEIIEIAAPDASAGHKRAKHARRIVAEHATVSKPVTSTPTRPNTEARSIGGAERTQTAKQTPPSIPPVPAIAVAKPAGSREGAVRRPGQRASPAQVGDDGKSKH